VVRFPRPLDHALLERTLTIAGPAGSRVEGKMVIGDEEKRWEFAPGSPWAPGSYELVIDRSLEDPSGNQIGQPFEVDQLEAPVEEKLPTERVRIRFEISRAKSAPRGASESR
jgi:hypothetical protein